MNVITSLKNRERTRYYYFYIERTQRKLTINDGEYHKEKEREKINEKIGSTESSSD